MSTEATVPQTASQSLLTREEQLQLARRILRTEADALYALATRVGQSFCRAAELVFACRGSVIVTGMGKAGLVGQKIAATLSSTGTPAHFVHPAEAIHGDLGRIGGHDVVLLLSQSGETAEVVQLLAPLAAAHVPWIAVTGWPQSTVARAATIVVELGQLSEACPLGLAPSTSTTAMLAWGDALALTVSRMKGFQASDFARLHPGGSLGRKLSRVEANMRPLSRCRVASDRAGVREVLVTSSQPGRRTGAIMLIDEAGHLTGLFTDSDLARLFEQNVEHALDRPVHEVMTSTPITVGVGTLLNDAMRNMAERKISELPVVDEDGRPAGLLDITDLVPEPEEFAPSAESIGPSRDSPSGLHIFSNDEPA